jgi:hypothetical protein
VQLLDHPVYSPRTDRQVRSGLRKEKNELATDANLSVNKGTGDNIHRN